MTKRQTICLIFFLCSCFLRGYSQNGTWTWISGDSALNAPAVYGTQGVPSVNNHPPAMYEVNEWKDKQGNFWIYGGTYPNMDDLWKFNPNTREWTWVRGGKTAGSNPIYGQKGVAAPANTPGSRAYSAPTWVDTAGTLWLFGGMTGYGAANDLWKYDIATNMWTWVTGDTVANSIGIYGTKGVPSANNRPGARTETASAWTDSANSLWLFGGYGIDKNPYNGFTYTTLGDMWRYNIGTGEWTWVAGADTGYSPAVFGTQGVSSATNDPGGRFTHSKWKDKQGNFWIMGGYSQAVWKYNPVINQWTWMSGLQLISDSAQTHAQCEFDGINKPGSRIEHRSSVTDNCGNFWLYGGTGYSGSTMYSDLWVFDPNSLEWNWIAGTPGYQPGKFGSLGVASASNIPPSRSGGVAWWGNDNTFYVFGGMHVLSFSASRGDMWMFEPDTSCISVFCNSVVGAPPVANFTSQTSVCENDCITYTDLSTNATSWQWTFEGGSPSSSTDQNPQVCYLASGIYKTRLIVSNASGIDSSVINNYITVNTSPTPPIIQQVNDTVLNFTPDTSYQSYQWYVNTTPIPNATDTFIVISQSGNYNVKITGNNGCLISVGINIILGVQNYMKENGFTLSPNPANEILTIYSSRPTIESIDIYNALGMLVVTRLPAGVGLKTKTAIDISDLAAGVYFLQVSGSRKRWTERFVKQ